LHHDIADTSRRAEKVKDLMHLTSSVLLVLALAGAIAPRPVAAQELPRLAAKADPKPVDRLMPASNVSASRLIVGVMYGTPDPSPEASLIVQVPPQWASASLCARLLSVDGLYEGRAEYDITNDSLGRLTRLDLVMSDKHWAAVSSLGPEGLGVAVTRGHCRENGKDHIAALWRGKPDRPVADLRLLVNSQGADEVTVAVRNNSESALVRSCEPIEGGAGVAFDRVCRIEATALASGNNLVQLNRMTMGSFEEPVEIVVEGPGNDR
jgi:hypothetical protein